MAKRKRSAAVKTWRFIKKQRRRRAKMSPTRRNQENLALLGGLATLPVLFFIGLPAAIFAGVASGGLALASKGSPPPGEKKRRNVNRKRATPMKSDEAIRLKKRMMSCSDACKFSTHDRKTCDCICGGASHGSRAGARANTTVPNKVRPRKSRARG